METRKPMSLSLGKTIYFCKLSKSWQSEGKASMQKKSEEWINAHPIGIPHFADSVPFDFSRGERNDVLSASLLPERPVSEGGPTQAKRVNGRGVSGPRPI